MIDFKKNEIFTSNIIRDAALTVLGRTRASNFEVHITNSPGYGMYSALNEEPLTISNGADDLVVGIQVTIPHELRETDEVAFLVHLATVALIPPSEQAQLDAVKERRNLIARLEAEIAELEK